MFKKLFYSLTVLFLLLTGCSQPLAIEEDGWYSSKEEVALYLETYGELPDNYLTKKEAMALGWNSKEGNLWEVADGMSIGGDKFGNREGILPEKDGRVYLVHRPNRLNDIEKNLGEEVLSKDNALPYQYVADKEKLKNK